MDFRDRLKSELEFKLAELPDEDIKEVTDFAASLIKKRAAKKSQDKKKPLDFSWVGSLSHLDSSPMELQDEAKKLWESTD